MGANAVPNTVLGNFNQPSTDGYQPISSLDYIAVPFVTDDQFLRVDGVEINAVNLLAPGNVVVEIWDMDAFAQPGNPVGALSGPTDPVGFSQYTGSTDLQADTSYFLVIAGGNGAGSIGTAIYTIDGNQVD
ncbi:hypothetical protein A3709_02175 [Halioglobus sp. HI00S01]|uniref:choice-of-anchor R domain-containing protein n=1 Tax=Halioglobus sp. HI00S01 TaxID=1822214 RepID=UPI0007C29BC2|nr:choice-of-anchor R domain-containing protein [Halioglobus sp. HI00S01]KZX58292.1 hypothetical protein A3709_02175 [Halioglobus sp. HI00S01]